MARKQVLIVDDDPDLRKGLSIYLRAKDYDTVFASDAVTAVQAALQHKPDVILLDLGLPAGDGFLVLERLRGNMQLEGIPVFVITARDAETHRDRALNAGAQAFFNKPVNGKALMTALAKAS